MKWTLLRIVGTQQIFSMEMGMGQMESRTNQMHRTSVEKKRIQRTTTTASTTMKRRGWTECGRARGKKKNKTKVITWICHLIYNLCLTFYVSALCCSLNCTRSRGTQYLFRKARKQWPDFFSFSFVLSISHTRARFVSRIWLRKVQVWHSINLCTKSPTNPPQNENVMWANRIRIDTTQC